MTTSTQTIIEFLLDRIAEDEGWAENALAMASIYDNVKWHWLRTDGQSTAWEPTNIDPARVLAECEAKRRIVERAGGVGAGYPSHHLAQGILAELASVYADHPDYRQEWRP